MPPGESLQIANFVRPDVSESTSGHTDRESASGHRDRKIAPGQTEHEICLLVKVCLLVSAFCSCLHNGHIFYQYCQNLQLIGLLVQKI